ncbi:GumC family protein, partial [Bacteroides nordii]|uniref:GumC family protein n=2 Tax=Bacteroides nordii TaxID=291645 RepID=UPI00241DC24F
MNTESKNNNSLEQESEINITDILRFVLSNWYWFVLSVLVCIGIAFFYVKSSSKVYSRKASVLIRDDSKGGGMSESAVFSDLSLFGGKRNVDNEVLVFQSRHLMEEVARRLHLDMSYKVKNGLRSEELYTHAPVTVSFPEAEERQVIKVVVTPVDSATVRLSGFSLAVGGGGVHSEEVLDVHLNDTVSTPIGPMVVTPTLYYTDVFYGKPVNVVKSNLESVIEGYRARLKVSLASKTATIINLVLDDVSTARAEDILNMLIAVYNEDVINDKNQIAVNTSKFINERLIIIERELGSVDANIESFKRENQLTDITSETGMYLANTSRYQQEGLSLENQLSIARYIKEYLTDPQKNSDLIPANTGISDNSVESQIKEYNDILLKRDKLVVGSSSKNPIVIDLNNSLSAMKQTIIRSVDNLIVGLNIQLKNIREQEEQTTKRIEAVPAQQKYVLTVERQQKIKEELYLYLLNKREENALTQAITESNARIIDAASGSSAP